MTEPENERGFTKTLHFALNDGLSKHLQTPNTTQDDSIDKISLSEPVIPTWRLPLQFSHQHILCLPTRPILATCRHHTTSLHFTTLTFRAAVAPSLIGENIPPRNLQSINLATYVKIPKHCTSQNVSFIYITIPDDIFFFRQILYREIKESEHVQSEYSRI